MGDGRAWQFKSPRAGGIGISGPTTQRLLGVQLTPDNPAPSEPSLVRDSEEGSRAQRPGLTVRPPEEVRVQVVGNTSRDPHPPSQAEPQMVSLQHGQAAQTLLHGRE